MIDISLDIRIWDKGIKGKFTKLRLMFIKPFFARIDDTEKYLKCKRIKDQIYILDIVTSKSKK